METTVVTGKFWVTFKYRGDSTQATVVSRVDGFIEGFGQVTRHHNDKPNRLVAEKYALQKALQNSNLDRNQRTEIWQAYHQN